MRFAIALLACVLCCSTTVIAQDFKLDHFKFYKFGSEASTDATIATKGQFDRDFKRVRIHGPWLFANPVSKNGGKILDEKAHFTAYFIRQGGAEPMRIVEFENPFGKQRAEIGHAELFLAPSGKVYKREQHPQPERLDHFKCYRVERAAAVDKKVALKDQFKSEENVAIRPVLFCVPVAKRHNDRETKINNERDHLVIYELEIHTSRPTFEIGTIDQFDDFRGVVYTVMWLAVPTAKGQVRVED